ncbi:hypothetical protein VT52_034665 [Streptomyces malaysiense]|uniref:Uncharacterized protein n=1 Tax=Streptomyces malaysiense TaxID=1428626 RepID=A0A1J4PQ71_9ACTN|nr:hypothetical protein [Streptomyces malaysiense]OIK23067.1 hypothetical protein VT52_034665 [Streptomyces malaysiense]
MNTEALKAEAVKAEPVAGAGFDPAFIPGITAPATPLAKQQEPGEPEEPEAEAPDGSTEPSRSAVSAEPEATGEAAEAEEGDSDEDEPAAPAGASDGPAFEAADRRAKIVADHKGVRLSLDEEACDFQWAEIAAVESEAPRFGKRYTVTVHTPDRRWYPIEIEATSRSRFKEWDDQLDAVLDAYFEDGD